MFTEAFDSGLIPMEFVNKTRKEGKLIMGIGHRVKSINNPDKRVTLVKEFAKDNFPKTTMLDYALETESITTSKKPNLILNVDGCIAVCFVDLLRHRCKRVFFVVYGLGAGIREDVNKKIFFEEIRTARNGF